jgi:hypothetical protein
MAHSNDARNTCCDALRNLAGAVDKFIAAGLLPKSNGTNQEAAELVDALAAAGQVLAQQR